MKEIVGSLYGRSVVITAGPTREGIDPVRFVSNYSSGKMGFALAEAAVSQGAQVTLVAGPVALDTPAGVKRIDVVTAEDMLNACTNLLPFDIFISAAAVADYKPMNFEMQKIKKRIGEDEGITVHLVRNPDIVKTVANAAARPFTVGFAAETENWVENAISKITSKNLDLIVLNDVADKQITFGSDFGAVTVIDRILNRVDIAMARKEKVAEEIVRIIGSASIGGINVPLKILEGDVCS